MSTSQAPGRAWELFAQPCPAMPGQAANMLSSLYLQLPVSKPGSQWCGTLRGLPAWGLGALPQEEVTGSLERNVCRKPV